MEFESLGATNRETGGPADRKHYPRGIFFNIFFRIHVDLYTGLGDIDLHLAIRCAPELDSSREYEYIGNVEGQRSTEFQYFGWAGKEDLYCHHLRIGCADDLIGIEIRVGDFDIFSHRFFGFVDPDTRITGHIDTIKPHQGSTTRPDEGI